MANPQTENGHTQIANEILEHLVRVHLSPNQWQVLLCIIRKTYGFHKKVDYIANSQIIESTGLGKEVVSRALRSLTQMNIIYRNKKHIGFQKDWEQWLAKPLTIGTKLAEQSTTEKLAIPSTKLAISSTKLAISSTKVSSPHVTQKIKETITKETIQKKASPKQQKKEFEEYTEELRPQYTDLDFDNQLRKFHLYWSEGDRKLKRPKLALTNWMDRARDFKKEKGNGTHRGHPQQTRITTQDLKDSVGRKLGA